MKSLSLAIIKRNIATIFNNNNSILDECALVNFKRIFYLSLIIIPSRILHIVLFSSNNPEPSTWSQGIILSHSVLLAFWIIIFLIAYRLKSETQATRTIHVLQYLVSVVSIVSAIIIVTLDQLITTSITPFLLTSIFVGAVFLIRPIISAIIYISSYLIYYYLMALTITSPDVLLSNRVNGTTAVCLGFFLSVMIWSYNYTNIKQKQCIEEQQKQLEQLAYFDPLTNLYNRHFLNHVIDKELALMQRYGHNSVIIILDVDDFKVINDTSGHYVGDQVLKELAGLIISNIRKSDIAARIGGEEFVVLAPSISLDEGYELAEKLRKIIAENAFSIGSTTSYITVSFGISLLQTNEDQEPGDCFSLADKALYRAKNKGKNRVEIAS